MDPLHFTCHLELAATARTSRWVTAVTTSTQHLPKGKSHVTHFIHKLANVGLGARCALCASYIGPHFAGPPSLRHSVLKTTNSSSLPWTYLSQERRDKDTQDEFNAPVLLAKKLRTKERSPGVRSTLFCHAARHTNCTKRASFDFNHPLLDLLEQTLALLLISMSTWYQ